MTSLAKQLKSLRTAVTTQLGVERPRKSLLFDRNQAASIYVEDALKIGRVGLVELQKIDPKIAKNDGVEYLFDDAAVNIQRAVLTKKENDELDNKLERLIVQLSAYLHHRAAKQVLEWLIFRFQIQTFNAETLFIAFLPYHNTNIFGRLLSILDLKGLEYDWTKAYAAGEIPIPMEKLVVIGTSRNHSLLTLLHNYIERVRELFDAKYLETKLFHLFNFYASICVHILANANVTDDLMSKILPFLARGLVCDVVSLRLACLVVISQLCTKATLVAEKLDSVVKLILLKMDTFTAKESLDTLVVICQRQKLNNFPLKSKTALKLARKDGKLHISDHIKSISTVTTNHPFIAAFARSFIPMLSKFDEEEKVMELCKFCIGCLDLDTLDNLSSEIILDTVFELLSESSEPKEIPDIFYKHMRALIIRFPNAFATVSSEWQVRDKDVLSVLKKACKFEPHEIECFKVEIMTSEKKKRRRRRSSASSSRTVDGCESSSSHITKPKEKRKRLEEIKKEQLSLIHEAPKVEFKSDPAEKLIDTIRAEDWLLAEAGLEKLTSSFYLKNRTASDFEDFFANLVAIALAEGARLKTKIKIALSQLPVNSDFALSLLKRYTESRSKRQNCGVCQWDCFKDEDNIKFEERRLFVLELLFANDSLQASAELFRQLYEILKGAVLEDGKSQYLQQLIINFIARLVKNPKGYRVAADDIQLDTIVDIIRSTQNHRILRDCLQLLTCAVNVSPKKVLSHLMSVYTFMGDGVLKKDNDLTLSVIEETLNVLFSTVMNEKDPLFHEHLVATSRLFSASIVDIPAHRRGRILHAVARSATSGYLWVVISIIFERFCLNWPKKTVGRTSVELFEEMSTIMASEYDAVEQLLCAADLIEHIIKLGGDFRPHTESSANTEQEKFLPKIFDRTKHSVQKLRHYRFAILGWIARLLESEQFQRKLSTVDDHSYDRLLETAKCLLFRSVELDDFVTTETSNAEKRSIKQKEEDDSEQQHANNCKYWIAISSRADNVIEKFQNLLPSHVCGELVADVLEQTATVPKLRDRALQFLNAKLLQHNSYMCTMKVNHLNSLMAKLNSWLRAVDGKIDADLCQKAAHTLKLIARNMSPSTDSLLFSETLELTTKLLTDRNTLEEAVTGSLLLLASELMRFQRVKNAILYSNSLTGVCTEILFAINEVPSTVGCGNHQNSPSRDNNALGIRRRRVQHSISGRFGAGGDALLVCSLICLQRIMENFAEFIFKHFSSIFIVISRLCCLCDCAPSADYSAKQLATNKYSVVQQRISHICRALMKLELRIVLESIDKACQSLMTEPAALGILFKIFSSIDGLKKRDVLLKFIGSVCDVYFRGLELRSVNAKLKEKKELIDSAELMVIDSLLEIVDNLSENEFRIVAKSMQLLLAEALSPESEIKKRLLLITIFRFLNRFYDVYKNLSLPHFGRFFRSVPNILSRCNSNHTDPSALMFHDENDSTLLMDQLLTVVINFVTNCSRHSAFLTLERAKAVLDSLIDELENVGIPGHQIRCVPHLAECLYHVIDCQNEILTDAISKIMLKTRSRRPKVRHRTLLFLECLFEHMGNAVAPVLPSVLPFLSELLEDDSKKVELQCDAVIGVLRKIFGDEITEGYV